MKNHVKKLLAAVLAGVMTLSLTVSAGAVSQFGAASKSSIDGSGDNQGGIPIDPIELVLPTTTAGMFDITLDPHGLINKTNAAFYKVDADANTTFNFSEDHLYFATSQETAEGGAVTKNYSGTSRSLTVINRSHVPVNVDLSLDVDKGDSPFSFVDSKDALAEAEGAAMYLALVSGDNVSAVKSPTSTDPIVVVSDPNNYIDPAEDKVPTLEFISPAEDADDDAVAALKELTDALKAALDEVSVTVSYVVVEDDPETTEEDESDAYIAGTIEGLPETLTVETDTVPADENVIEFTITNVVEAEETPDDVATITINVVAAEETMDPDADPASTVSFKIPVANATVKTAISMNEDAYVYANIASLNEEQLRALTVPVTAKGYYWKQVVSADADYPAISFNLVGDINSDPEEGDPLTAWDNISVVTDDPANPSTINFTLTWDVKAYDKTEARDFGDGGESGGSAKEPQGDLPTVTVTTKATSSSKKSIVITWTAGTEDYEAYTPSTTLALSNDKTLTMTLAETATGGTLTNTNAYTTIGAAGVVGTVTFTAEGLDDLELETTALR